MAEKCKECGCNCLNCNVDINHSDMHLHEEIENLRQCLMDRDNHIIKMETQFLNEADKFPNGELASIKEEVILWQEKYTRLCEAHKKMQKVNSNLEDKLLKIVDKCETEKGAFAKDIATLSHRLADANFTIHRLTQDNEKYRNDVNLAIQLLQCKPSNFVGQKYDLLPSEVQAKVRTYVAQKRDSSESTNNDVKSITVPISTFPPTAMVYNVTKPIVEKDSDNESDESKPPVDMVSAAIMAKVLEDRERERIFAKHCNTCTCNKSIPMVDGETQTALTWDGMQDPVKRKEFLQNNNKTSKDTINHKTTVFQQVDENLINNGKEQFQSTIHQDNKYPDNNLNNMTESTRDNFNSKLNLNKKQYDTFNWNSYRSQSGSKNKQQTIFHSNTTILDKGNNQIKSLNKQIDPTPHIELVKRSINCVYSNHGIENEQRNRMDIINDRLSRNEWKEKYKSPIDTSNDIKLDVINERLWTHDKRNDQLESQLTVIEVKNFDDKIDSSQIDTATSPSYSSDSVVISTSDPSSSSSDVVQSIHGTRQQIFDLHCQKKKLNRPINRSTTGPRNCLVRITPGSQNILLDNIEQYQTVMYTSGSNKSNHTALVHTKKQLKRPDSEKSTTSSEEGCPILFQDNNQLQRVAEWVQSSVCIDNHSNQLKSNENANTRSYYENPIRMIGDVNEQEVKVNKINQIQSGEIVTPSVQDKDKDLISFDSPSEGEKSPNNNFDYNHVNITKEMEETYLQLAASLDPVVFNLSNSLNNPDLTIEQYRQDHKKSSNPKS